MLKKNLRTSIVICGICVLFICLSITPSMGSNSKDCNSVSSLVNSTGRASEGDIPTWYQGDEWIYTVDPLYFSSPNGSFSGVIENFKQKVTGITDDMYTVAITGDISGSLTVNSFSGDLTGQITGTSHVRVSDLAEVATELNSQGEIVYVWIPFPYELNLITSSAPPLELYDFPLNVGEQWQIGCMSTVSGSFSIQGMYDQSFNGSQWVDETVECVQKEQISVPAGTFDCYKIGRSTTPSWYSTDVGNMVKSVIDQNSENMTLQINIALQSFSHAAQPITVSGDIEPAMVAPGATIVISGQAISTSSGDPVSGGVISLTIPSTGDSWSTTTNSGGFYSKTIVAPTMTDDTASGRETGSGGVIVTCTSGGLSGYRVQTLTTIQDTPPATPSIQGETKGKPGVSYSYTVATADPEADPIFYYVDWGDNTNSSWVGPFPSNENVTLNHTFAKKGNYIIKVKARDVYFAESDWGTLQVSMPKPSSFPILMKFLERFPFLFSILQHFLRQ